MCTSHFVTKHEALNRLLAIPEDVSDHEEADSTVASMNIYHKM